MQPRVIVIDDDRDYLDLFEIRLRSAGFTNVTVEDASMAAAERFEDGQPFDIALVDITMPEMDGVQLLQVIKHHSPRTECIMITAINDARVAVNCLKKGAYDYLVKPISEEDLVFALNRTLERKRLLDILDIEKGARLPELVHKEVFKPIITRSSRILRVLKESELHAGSNVPILITGESGTGKELLAQAIHAASLRSRYNFTPVNMAALSGSLFEAEFFGHTRGAFTGAVKDRAGILKRAHKGTLFLDEIGVLPLDLQGKLLRVLQDGEYNRLGASTPQYVDVRLIAATNEDLEQMMEAKSFRKDLYYRIRGGWLHMPPLRERREDIPLLVDHFLKNHSPAAARSGIDETAMCLLMEYRFPGNIRELRSIVHAAANLSQGNIITPDALPDSVQATNAVLKCRMPAENDTILTLETVEKNHILNTYRLLQSNKSQTARQLGIGLNTLRRKLKYYGID
jgi:DNA-binding NtrC family response regulator